MSSDPALDVAAPSPSTGTPSSSHAGTRVLRVSSTGRTEPVFDLEVEDCHEFFANGVLVHNSHAMAALRYAEHNLQVIKRKGGARRVSARPVAAEDDAERLDERAGELEHSVSAAVAEGPRVIRAGADPKDRMEVSDLGGADDSPLRDETRSMDEHLYGRPLANERF